MHSLFESKFSTQCNVVLLFRFQYPVFFLRSSSSCLRFFLGCLSLLSRLLSAYFTVRITCPYLKSPNPNPSEASSVRYSLYELNIICDKYLVCRYGVVCGVSSCVFQKPQERGGPSSRWAVAPYREYVVVNSESLSFAYREQIAVGTKESRL